MAEPEFLELEFADGRRGVDQPYANWIIEATGGETAGITFKRAMKMINNKPEQQLLRSVESQIYREHFRGFGG